MAWTARKGDDILEYEEDEVTLDKKCKELAALIKGSKHCVLYTGAGISCSAGIPDFRGPKGVWTMAAQGKKAEAKVSTLQAVPTPAHMSIVKLQNEGILKHLISSNCDGLHVRSGIHPHMITEVHGNGNREECNSCGKSYYRDFGTRCNGNFALAAKLKLEGRAKAHFTGRQCVCGGALMDSIINFGENLSEKAIDDGFYHGKKADVMVAMGASLTVSPSCNMVEATKKTGGKLVIINLQKTPYDDICDLRIFNKTDAVWIRVMKYLELDIPEFKLERRVAFWKDGKDTNCVGVARDGTPSTWIKAIAAVDGAKVVTKYESEHTTLQEFKISPDKNLVLFSFGYYNECPVQLEFKLDKLPCFATLTYSPSSGKWEQKVEDDAENKLKDLCKLINSKACDQLPKNIPQDNDNNFAVPGKKPAFEGGYAVYPRTDCPHLENIVLDNIVIDCQSPCEMCKDPEENWVCLHCNHVFCSRYKNKHMVDHVEGEGKCHKGIVGSYSDFSFWCNQCDDYISHPSLNVVRKAMELSKFSKE